MLSSCFVFQATLKAVPINWDKTNPSKAPRVCLYTRCFISWACSDVSMLANQWWCVKRLFCFVLIASVSRIISLSLPLAPQECAPLCVYTCLRGVLDFFLVYISACLLQGGTSVSIMLSDGDTRPNCEKQEILQRTEEDSQSLTMTLFQLICQHLCKDPWVTHLGVRKGELCSTQQFNHWPLGHLMGHCSSNAKDMQWFVYVCHQFSF